MKAQLAAAAALVALATACGPVRQTSVGEVVQVDSAVVCLGLAGPVHLCFEAEAPLLRDVHVGACVQISALVRGGRAPIRVATAIEQVSSAANPDMCGTG